MLLTHIIFLFGLLVLTESVNGSNGLGKGCDDANVICLEQTANIFALRRDIGDRKLTSSLHWWNFFSYIHNKPHHHIENIHSKQSTQHTTDDTTNSDEVRNDEGRSDDDMNNGNEGNSYSNTSYDDDYIWSDTSYLDDEYIATEKTDDTYNDSSFDDDNYESGEMWDDGDGYLSYTADDMDSDEDLAYFSDDANHEGNNDNSKDRTFSDDDQASNDGGSSGQNATLTDSSDDEEVLGGDDGKGFDANGKSFSIQVLSFFIAFLIIITMFGVYVAHQTSTRSHFPTGNDHLVDVPNTSSCIQQGSTHGDYVIAS